MNNREEIYEALVSAMSGLLFASDAASSAGVKARSAARAWLKDLGFADEALSVRFASMVRQRLIPKEERAAKRADYYSKNRESELVKAREYRAINPEVIKLCSKRWKMMNRKRCSNYSSKRRAELRASSVEFRLRDNLGNLVRNSLSRNGFAKNSRTSELICCEWEFFRSWIESNFKDGMSWQNRSEWHVDHYFPVGRCISSRDAEKSFHWRNLVPKTASENCSKRHSLTEGSICLARAIGIEGVKIYRNEEWAANVATRLGMTILTA